MRTPRPWILPTSPTPRATLLATGVTDEMIRTQLAAGQLQRLRHGVLLSAACWPEDPAGQHLVLAHAEQASNPSAVLSHHTAALVWGLPTPGFTAWYDNPPCLTLPPESNHRRRMSATVRTASLRAADVTRDPLGYPVTTVARTAVDLAGRLDLPQVLVLLDAAGRRLVESWKTGTRRHDYANPRLVREVRESLTMAAGSRPTRRLLSAIEKVEPCRESPVESLTAGHLYLSGLPIPIFQAPIRSPMGTLYPDCYWPEKRLIGEADGALKYADQAAIVAEKQREQWFRDEAFGVVRWLGKEIMVQPQRVMARIEAALA